MEKKNQVKKAPAKEKTANELPKTVLTNKKKSFWQILLSQKMLIAMSVPFVLYIILFKYVPLTGWSMAFHDFYRPSKKDFVWGGLKWFKQLFKDAEFTLALRNTVCMSLISTALGYITAIILAVFMNEVKNLAVKRVVQTLSYLPHFLSWIIVTSLVANVLSTENGILNDILLKLGFIDTPILFLSVPKYFWHIIGWTYVWKEVGWNTIVYLGAMTSVDPCLYEAAEIDGCGRLRKIWHITLPGIRPTIIIMMIMSAGHILDANFEMPYFLKNSMIEDVSNTIDIYVLKYGFRLFNYSLATAAGIFKNVVNILLLLIANWIAKKSGEERLI